MLARTCGVMRAAHVLRVRKCAATTYSLNPLYSRVSEDVRSNFDNHEGSGKKFGKFTTWSNFPKRKFICDSVNLTLTPCRTEKSMKSSTPPVQIYHSIKATSIACCRTAPDSFSLERDRNHFALKNRSLVNASYDSGTGCSSIDVPLMYVVHRRKWIAFKQICCTRHLWQQERSRENDSGTTRIWPVTAVRKLETGHKCLFSQISSKQLWTTVLLVCFGFL